MLPNYRRIRSLVPAFPLRSPGSLDLDRASSPMLVIAMVLSLAFATLTAVRLVRVEQQDQPALSAARELGGTLDAIRALLRDGRAAGLELRLARADSLADRFHAIAQRAPAGERHAQQLAVDAIFAEYYVAARRAADGLSMSADADGSSAEDASLGYAMLRENLAADMQAHEEAIDAARPATAPIELVTWLAMTLLSAAALLRRNVRTSRSAPAVTAASAHVEERRAPMIAADATGTILLQEAVERLARKRLAASIAAAQVAKRNNDRQIELARTWHAPQLSIVPATPPSVGMDVYEHDEPDASEAYGRLALMAR